MTLLNALEKAVAKFRGITQARTAHFAFDDSGGNAFVSEIPSEELVPLVEEWCREMRAGRIGSVQ